jgi:hypothetical protein
VGRRTEKEKVLKKIKENSLADLIYCMSMCGGRGVWGAVRHGRVSAMSRRAMLEMMRSLGYELLGGIDTDAAYLYELRWYTCTCIQARRHDTI